MTTKSNSAPKRILVVDIGGSNVKLLATGAEKRIKFPSGSELTPQDAVSKILETTDHWQYDAVSVGCPCSVADNTPTSPPTNLGKGWVGFDFEKAFGLPTKVINDATMQAIGCYEGGTMLFLGFGTGLGTTLIKNGTAIPLEGGHLPYRKDRSFEEYVGKSGFAHLGEKKWNKHVLKTIDILRDACNAEDVVIGGGNAKLVEELPENTRRVNNHAAFTGGFRMWEANW